MTRLASPSPTTAGSGTRSSELTMQLDEVLSRFMAEIDAAAVGVRLRDGSVSREVTLSDVAAHVLEDVWRHSALGLMDQVDATGSVVGTNRLRAHSEAPVCGKLIAIGLRDAGGAVIGLLAALRTVEQPKFTARDSERLVEFGPHVSQLMMGRSTLEPASPPPEAAPSLSVTAAHPVSAPPPTGLTSWSDFEARAAERERTSPTGGCVLYGDVDQLHVLNKLAGFAAGDRAIAAVGEALRDEKLPEGGCACHLSGDRFTIYLPATTLSQARRIAEHLCRVVSERCSTLDGLRTRLSMSFGVAAISASEHGIEQALAAAETACRAAKDRGRGRVEVYQDADQSIIRRNDDVLLAGKLRRALETQRIGIVAQPLLNLQDERPVDYYELLVRLIDESGALISPAPFMSAATRYQMLADLDRIVIGRVFDRLQAARARLAGRGIRFSINLSGATLADPSFLEWLASNIGPGAVSGEWLQFELTESAAVANVTQTQALIRRLRIRGVEFALDDFGTGVSSFAYLKTFDIGMLKLDASFTRDLLTDPRCESLVRGIAQLGQGMGIQTVAEGVETPEVRDRLMQLGIDRAQGFLFGQPLPFESVLDGTAPSPVGADVTA